MRRNPSYQHGLLVHHTEDDLIERTRAFVAQGLAARADVLVHGTTDRVHLMREVLGTHPRLEYGLDEELYQKPMPTLFAYQRKLAARSESTGVWVTGTVPLGRTSAEQAAWGRYESAVDAALGDYPFVAMCTYDTRTCPDPVVAAARATHRNITTDRTSNTNPDYLGPTDFLTDPLAQVPDPPSTQPSATATISDFDQLRAARHLLRAEAHHRSAVCSLSIEKLLVAFQEVAVNGLVHGIPPVRMTLWAEVATLTCLVQDVGRGNRDPMSGFRHPDAANGTGLWAARQLVDDLLITDAPSGGCDVLLTVSDEVR